MIKQSLSPKEYNPYFNTYLSKVKGDINIRTGLLDLQQESSQFLESIEEEKFNYSYGLNKWTLKEVLQHIIDTERIFTYRLLRIGRGDKTALMGFDQDIYNPTSHANEKTKNELIEEYRITRAYSLSILNSLNDEDLLEVGMASGYEVSARAIVFITIGHEIHHIDVIKDKYLVS